MQTLKQIANNILKNYEITDLRPFIPEVIEETLTKRDKNKRLLTELKEVEEIRDLKEEIKEVEGIKLTSIKNFMSLPMEERNKNARLFTLKSHIANKYIKLAMAKKEEIENRERLPLAEGIREKARIRWDTWKKLANKIHKFPRSRKRGYRKKAYGYRREYLKIPAKLKMQRSIRLDQTIIMITINEINKLESELNAL